MAGVLFDWDAPVPDDEREKLLADMASQVARRGLATPAVWILEIHRPVMPLLGQAAIAFSPFLGTLFAGGAFDLQKYTKLMQKRQNVERLIALIEEKEQEARQPDTPQNEREPGDARQPSQPAQAGSIHRHGHGFVTRGKRPKD